MAMTRLLALENVNLLSQGISALQLLSDESYLAGNPESGGSIGKHFRHIVNHYEAFLNAKDTVIDYETRERGGDIERDRGVANQMLHEISDALLGASAAKFKNETVLVERRVLNDAGEPEKVALASSAGRELDFLAQHTTHHFAVIAILARSHGIQLPNEFGMSSSTLRYAALVGSAP